MGRPPASLLKDTHPDIAAQVVDTSLLATLGTGSAKKIEFRCPEFGHTYFAQPFNKTNAKRPTGCPICDGKKVLVGFNDLATTQPDVAQRCTDPNDALTHTALSNKKISFTCPDGHTWTAPIARVVSQSAKSPYYGCPYCSGRKAIPDNTDLATTRPDLAKHLVDPNLAKKLKAGSMQVVEWRCTVQPRHIYEASVYDRARSNNTCPYCSGRRVEKGYTDLATTHPDVATYLIDPTIATQVKAGSERTVDWRCTKQPRHTYSTTVYNRTTHGNMCPYCSGHRTEPGYTDLATTHPDLAQHMADPHQATTISSGSGIAVEWVCPDNPDHTWFATVYSQTHKPFFCPICQPPYSSIAQQELYSIITTLIGKEGVCCANRSILKEHKLELDIVIEPYKIAIEFNGVYWHSSAQSTKTDYHALKTRYAKEKGYQLIHIWEDDFNTKKNIIITTLAYKLNALDKLLLLIPDIDPHALSTAYTQKLTPRIVPDLQSHKFLNEHHIQGSVSATYHLGLYDEMDTLRALISLQSPKDNTHMNRKEGEWEIQRYATLGSIPDGFTKLLNYARTIITNDGHTLHSWISFSSNDISEGHLYQSAGFTLDAEIEPDYSYVGTPTKWTRAPKESFQKKRFRDDPALKWDPEWTERQCAEENKLYRIYDAGKKRWIKNVI